MQFSVLFFLNRIYIQRENLAQISEHPVDTDVVKEEHSPNW